MARRLQAGRARARGSRARHAAKAGKTEADIDWLIPHQANIRIMEGTAKKLKLAREKLIVTVDEHGNTSAASIPAGTGRRGALGQGEEGRHADARRRWRRLHLGRGAAELCRRAARQGSGVDGDTNMKSFAFVFPGQGSQAVGMLDAWGDHPQCSKRCARPPMRSDEDIAA
jgi:hypothetical protein